MADNDIQFLGNWNSQQSSSNSTFISAIVLTPISSGMSPSDVPRTFSRTQTSVVHVGRTPADRPVAADDRVSFVNPVMSRNHAKITFADSGSAFLIDTNSHHGTWVARPARQGSRFKLSPESPYQLQDGDELTFGKQVQRDGICYEPLTVAVKLLRTTEILSPGSESNILVPIPSKLVFTSPKPRNRFGLNSSSDSDSDASSSESRESQSTDSSTGLSIIQVGVSPPRISVLELQEAPKSSKPVAFEGSEPLSPVSALNSPSTPQHSPPRGHVTTPLYSPASPASPGLPSLPGLEPEVSRGDQLGVSPSKSSTSLADTHDSNNSQGCPGALPPWRRLSGGSAWSSMNATLNISPGMFNRMPDILPSTPRRIGRLLNPLWMRAARGVANDGNGPEGAERPDLLNRFQTGSEATNMHERHGHSSDYHERHLHVHGRHGGRLHASGGSYGQNIDAVKDEVRLLGEQLDQVRKAVEALNAKGEERTELHDGLSARLEGLSSQLKSLQEGKDSQVAVFAELKEVNTLKESVAAMQQGISTMRVQQSTMQTDLRFLRVDQGGLRNDLMRVKDDVEIHANDTNELSGDARTLLKDTRVLKDDLDALREYSRGLKDDLGKALGEFVSARGHMETLQSDMQRSNAVSKAAAAEIHAFTAVHAATEQKLHENVRDEVRKEIKALMQRSGEMPALVGKRKREDDGFIDADMDVPALVLASLHPVSRPRKRIRIMVDCAAAGAVGVIGAWLGLAFL